MAEERRGFIGRLKLRLLAASEWMVEHGLMLANPVLRQVTRKRYVPGSVLHVSVMVHTAYQAATVLRANGVNAKYLAIGASPLWNKCDFVIKRSRWPFVNKWREFITFWTLTARFEVVHSHFMLMPSDTLWEADQLKAMGRKLVAHFRGCEARDRQRNMRLHPHINICQQCDHKIPICEQPLSQRRRLVAERCADAILVTTPDMKDFYPEAEHVPFFTPTHDSDLYAPLPGELPQRAGRPFKIVHVTVHPGIEGTREIEAVVERLRQRGYDIDFVFLQWVPQDVIRRELATADLAIGKMKMGYYANSQIESMMMGVPTVTYVREEFMTPALAESGFILTTLDRLEGVLAHYIDCPAAFADKRRIARESIVRLHDNDRIAQQLKQIYARISPNFVQPAVSHT